MPSEANALSTIPGPTGRGRLIVVGDIHGCIDELHALLDRLAPSTGDIVVSAGDIARKGPRPDLCLELWRARGFLAVIGNNEEKLLAFARRNIFRRWLLPSADRVLLRRPDLMEYIRGWPVVIDIPAARAAIVHGGLLPDMELAERDIRAFRHELIRLRFIRREGDRWVAVAKGRQIASDVLWPVEWRGERTVLYGHTPLRAPRVDERAIGLDTGCVYGGDLTAAVHQGGEWRLERVPARRAYARR